MNIHWRSWPLSGRGCEMLIVNADDYGAAPSATDAILRAWRARAVTCASAMVWMHDSARAARLAREEGLPLGLHLNLTLPFPDEEMGRAVRERQAELTSLFNRETWMSTTRTDPPRDLVREAVRDQLERFRDEYGELGHVNGHHHVHVHPTVLDALPAGIPVRPILRSVSRADARTSGRKRRSFQRFPTPALALDFEQLHPALGGTGFGVLGRCADGVAVEVMTHPQRRAELQALLSTEWLDLVARLPTGACAELAGTARSL